MNCFSHALPHLDDAYLAVGSCLPDWLSACDRKCRAHEKNAAEFVAHSDSIVSTTARGVVAHHRDDEWFHNTPVFEELSGEFTGELRRLFSGEPNLRPSFIAHIVIELFLDAWLHAENPGKLDFFYDQIATVDPLKVQDAVNLFSTKPTDRLAPEIKRFMEARFLFDYVTDQGIVYRLNRVFQRVKLATLGDSILAWMPDARKRVYENGKGLLSNGSKTT